MADTADTSLITLSLTPKSADRPWGPEQPPIQWITLVLSLNIKRLFRESFTSVQYQG
jgi:hypothetical protein